MYARAIVLNWDSRQRSAQQMFAEELAEILKPFCGGQCPVIIEYIGGADKASLQLGEEWRVRPSDELILRLRRYLSPEAVEVRYKN